MIRSERLSAFERNAAGLNASSILKIEDLFSDLAYEAIARGLKLRAGEACSTRDQKLLRQLRQIASEYLGLPDTRLKELAAFDVTIGKIPRHQTADRTRRALLPFLGVDETLVRRLFAYPMRAWPRRPYQLWDVFVDMQGLLAIALAIDSFLYPEDIYNLDVNEHFHVPEGGGQILVHVEAPLRANFPVSALLSASTSLLLRRYQTEVLAALPGQPTRIFSHFDGTARLGDLRAVIPALTEKATGHRLSLIEISALIDALYLRDHVEEPETVKRARGLKSRLGVRERCDAFIALGTQIVAVKAVESHIDPKILNPDAR